MSDRGIAIHYKGHKSTKRRAAVLWRRAIVALATAAARAQRGPRVRLQGWRCRLQHCTCLEPQSTNFCYFNKSAIGMIFISITGQFHSQKGIKLKVENYIDFHVNSKVVTLFAYRIIYSYPTLSSDMSAQWDFIFLWRYHIAFNNFSCLHII